MVAEEARELMAALGVKRFGDLVGRTELLIPNDDVEHWKARSLDLRPLLAIPGKAIDAPRGHVTGDAGRPRIGASFDERELIPAARAGDRATASRSGSSARVTNIDLAVGGRLSNAVVRERGADGPARRHDLDRPARLGRAERRRLARARRDAARSTATSTTTPARASPAASSRCARPTTPATGPSAT